LIKHLCWRVTNRQHIIYIGGQKPPSQMNHGWRVCPTTSKDTSMLEVKNCQHNWPFVLAKSSWWKLEPPAQCQLDHQQKPPFMY
jgi:hypothetical protein